MQVHCSNYRVKGNTKHFNHVLAWNVISLVSKLPFLYQVLPACPFGPLVHYGLEAKVVYSVKLGKENNGGHSHIQSKWVAQSSVFQYKLVLYIKINKKTSCIILPVAFCLNGLFFVQRTDTVWMSGESFCDGWADTSTPSMPGLPQSSPSGTPVGR